MMRLRAILALGLMAALGAAMGPARAAAPFCPPVFLTSTIAQDAACIFRDWTLDGVPSSGVANPKKSEIRSLMNVVGNGITQALGSNAAGAFGYATRAALNADLAHGAGTLGTVFSDSTSTYNGVYIKIGASGSGSWSQVSTSPYGLTPTWSIAGVNLLSPGANPTVTVGGTAAAPNLTFGFGYPSFSAGAATANIGGSPTFSITGTATNPVLNFGLPLPNLQVGATTTLPPGSAATASISGPAANPLLNIGVPAGPPQSVSVGTVTTVPYGSSPTVTMTNSGTNTALNFGLPSGPSGALRWRGAWSSGGTYALNDLVSQGGSIYIANTASPSGTPGVSGSWDVFITPTGGSLGGVLTGTLPNPGLAPGAASADIGATTLEAQAVSPRCVADGVTDCRPAMLAAIASFSYAPFSAQSGGKILLKGSTGGCYYFSSSIDTAGKYGLEIVGASRRSTCVTNGTGNYPIFVNNATVSAPTTHVAIRHMTFNCSGRTNANSKGIVWKYVATGAIEDNYFLGCARDIEQVGAWQVKIFENRMEGAGSQQNGTCLWMGMPTDSLDLYHNNAVVAFDNVCEGYSDYGLRWENAAGSNFIHNQWLGGKKGVYGCDPPSATFADGTNSTCQFVFHYGDQADTQTEQNVLIKKGSASLLYHVYLTGMWAGSGDNLALGAATTANLYGIHIEDGFDIQVLGLHMSNQEGGVLFKNVNNSVLTGEIIGANPSNNGSYYALMNGTSGAGSSSNTIILRTTGINRIGYNGYGEIGLFGQNAVYGLGGASCSPTWTIGGATNTPGTGGCYYEITGMKTHVQGDAEFSGPLSGVGVAKIANLPVSALASGTSAGAYGAISPVMCFSGCLGLTGNVIAQLTQGDTTANLYIQTATGVTALTNANFDVSPKLQFQLDYFRN